MQKSIKNILLSFTLLISSINAEEIFIGVLEVTEEVIELSGPTFENPSLKEYSSLWCDQDEVGDKIDYTLSLSIDTGSRTVLINGTPFDPKFFNYIGNENKHTSLNVVGENVWNEIIERNETNSGQEFVNKFEWKEDTKIRYLHNSPPQLRGKIFYIENYSVRSYSNSSWDGDPYDEHNAIECVQTSKIVGNLKKYDRYPTANEQISIIRAMKDVLRTSKPDSNNASGVRKKSRSIGMSVRG